jgi:hypothetical protein
MADMTAYNQGLPCKNPSCASHGKPHPNCRCYMAEGGVIKESFCASNRMHHPDCEYYAEGGPVAEERPIQPQMQDNPEDTIGHAGAEQGLLGLLTKVGHRKLADPEKHIPKLQESMANPDREKAAEKLSGHPLVGMSAPQKILANMDHLHQSVMTQEPSPDAFRNANDYLSSALRGHNALDNKAKELFGDKEFSDKMEPDSDSRGALKKHLDDVRENPNKMLEVGGMLGHYLPGHAASLGAHAAQAVNYLNSLRPTQAKNGPLDAESPIDKFTEAKYHRALDIAEQPLMAMHYAKEGTLLPQDVNTLMTLYPGLHKSMVNKVGEALIEAKHKGIEIPYKQRRAVSMLIGQPLDSTMSPQAMQTIIMANRGAQAPKSQPQKPPKKASGVELKQINQVNKMDETPIQARLLDRKS